MRKLVVILLLTVNPALGQSVESVKLADLQKTIHGPSDKILVINFWATWCGPCIKELPLFEKLHQDNKKVEVLLVSMDYDLDPSIEKVERFRARKNLQSKILFLTEHDPNSWIEKIDSRWSGALPATLIINSKNGKREFVQGEVEEGEIDRLVTKVNN
jgi:thiol-disulfide isomerase/thioredoxin